MEEKQQEKKAKVVLVPCDIYEEETVYRAMKCGMDALGGIREFVDPEEKILVKPNFVLASPPEAAATTHPSVMKGMFRLLQEAGCTQVLYGDSPGHGSCTAAAGKLGMEKEETIYGARQTSMSEEVKVAFPDGITAKEFYFAKEVTETDAIINLCKMKTHALERVTGAVKNLYGLICGYRKAAGHVAYPNATVFARMLVDIHRYTKPRLHVMDGIMAMEGNGPGSGDPTPMNVLLFSADPVALDTVFCEMVYLNPEAVPTNSQGAVMGLGTDDPEKIEICVAHPEDGKVEILDVPGLQERFGNPDFNVDRAGTRMNWLKRFSETMTAIAKRPHIDPDKCIKCGICVEHCPVPGKAVAFQNGKQNPPVYDYSKCIRCYCCQEMCPRSAIRPISIFRSMKLDYKARKE